LTPFQPATSSRYNAQKPKVSVRWQPLDPKYIGALTLRGSYSEALRAPQLFEMTPAGTQTFVQVADPFSTPSVYQVEELDSGIPGVVGPVTSVIVPHLNLSGAVVEGLDYEATYILESSIFGHGDWGRLTTTVNGTWLSRFVFSSFPTPNTKPFGLAGLFFVGNGFPWHRASFSLYYDGPRDTWMQGLDAGAV